LGLRSRIGSVFGWIGSAYRKPELPPRAERRRAARQRHRQDGPGWSSSDRHLNGNTSLPVSESADTGGLGNSLIDMPRLDPPRH
jgi:hypothetical protein